VTSQAKPPSADYCCPFLTTNTFHSHFCRVVKYLKCNNSNPPVPFSESRGMKVHESHRRTLAELSYLLRLRRLRRRLDLGPGRGHGLNEAQHGGGGHWALGFEVVVTQTNCDCRAHQQLSIELPLARPRAHGEGEVRAGAIWQGRALLEVAAGVIPE
jgi:hypothetical protein